MRRLTAWIAGVCLVAASAGAPAQDGAAGVEPVVIAHRFQKGDRFDLEITKKRDPGGRRPSRAMTSLVEVEILDVQENRAAAIAWTLRLSQTQKDLIAEAKEPADVQAAAMLEAVDGMRVEFDLDEVGEIAGLRNFEEVKKTIDRMMEIVQRLLNGGALTKEQVDAVMEMTRETYSDPGRATATLMTDPRIYFQAYGYELTPGEPLAADIELPNAFGGPDFPGESTMELVDYTPESNKIRLAGLTRIKPEEGKAALLETLRLMAARLGRPPPKDDEAQTLSINDEQSYTIDRATGMIEFAKFVRSVRFGESTRRDETVIRLVTKDEKRPAGDPGVP